MNHVVRRASCWPAKKRCPEAVPADVKRHFISVLDGDPIWPMPEVCTKCRSPWFCTCPKDKDDLAVHNVRERSPPPPPPGMVEILCMRMPREEAEAPPHRRHEVREAREAKRRRLCEVATPQRSSAQVHATPQRSSGPMEVDVSLTDSGPMEVDASLTDSTCQRFVLHDRKRRMDEDYNEIVAKIKEHTATSARDSVRHGDQASVSAAVKREGQKDWEAVQKVLPPKTLLLERTKPMFEELLTDEHIKVWLPSSDYYIQHCHRVVALIPRDYGFKIGITVDPSARYYESHYAYSKSRSQQRDHVRYNSMVVIYTDHSRRVIAMMEHALIDHFRIHFPRRCANRKIDFDSHIRFDESGSSDNEHSPGPHSLYVCYGPRM